MSKDDDNLTPKPGFVVAVARLPKCDFCDALAQYDFITRSPVGSGYGGPWAHGCARHWEIYRNWPTLGVGKGQRLVLKAGKNAVLKND